MTEVLLWFVVGSPAVVAAAGWMFVASSRPARRAARPREIDVLREELERLRVRAGYR